MFFIVEDLLNAGEIQELLAISQRVRFVDGRRSNPHNTTKLNTLADVADPLAQRASALTQAALLRSEAARAFALPRRSAVPSLTRYSIGMSYGAHADAAFLPVSTPPLRSDLSCTVFVSDPASYGGGELLIYLGSEQVAIKGKAGSAVLYPSTSVHQVMPVTSGERLVMITFIESLIPDAAQREIIVTLEEMRAVEGLKISWQSRIQLEGVLANLQRMWSR